MASSTVCIPHPLGNLSTNHMRFFGALISVFVRKFSRMRSDNRILGVRDSLNCRIERRCGSVPLGVGLRLRLGAVALSALAVPVVPALQLRAG